MTNATATTTLALQVVNSTSIVGELCVFVTCNMRTNARPATFDFTGSSLEVRYFLSLCYLFDWSTSDYQSVEDIHEEVLVVINDKMHVMWSRTLRQFNLLNHRPYTSFFLFYIISPQWITLPAEYCDCYLCINCSSDLKSTAQNALVATLLVDFISLVPGLFDINQKKKSPD